MAAISPRGVSIDTPDDERTWTVIKTGLDKIFGGVNLVVAEYMQIYSAIHNHCTSMPSRDFRQRNTGLGSAHRGAHLLGGALYERLSFYLKEILTQIHQEAQTRKKEQLLDYYNEQWDRFVACSRMNHYLWWYHQRHWIKREMDEGKKDVYTIFDLHLREWKFEMLDTMHDNLSEILLDLIRRQRDGEYVDQLPRKSFIGSIMTLRHVCDEDDVYQSKSNKLTKEWEDLFRSSTTEYYEKVAVEDLAECEQGEYFDRVERRILDEEKNTALFLPDYLKFTILRTCEKILITDHLGLYLASFNDTLTRNDLSKLAQLYRLLARVPSGLDSCYSTFEKHVLQAGLSAVNDAIALGTMADKKLTKEGLANGESVNPNLFSEHLEKVIKKYQTLVQLAFNVDKEFNRSIDRACRAFVNWNRACIYDSDAPELLAKHTENLLRRAGGNGTSESDLLRKITDAAIIFKYLEDKDAFITLYSRMLARRLVQDTSVSEEVEKSMLSQLREAYDHTGKLKQMLLDMDTVKELDGRFQDWQFTRGATLEKIKLGDQVPTFTTSFKVLSAANWPLKPPTGQFVLPTVISKVHDEFSEFYREQQPGRKLLWYWQLCYGEMRMHLKNDSSKGHTLYASAYQIAILLLFNENHELSYEEIKRNTELPPEILDTLLSVFLKTKLLKLEKRPSTKFYALNDNFTSKKVKIDIRVSLKKQKNAEMGETHRKIKEERKLLMQATIVRIMKSRRKMTYQLLALEVVRQLQARFAPKDPDIKRCVDLLIDKEFLERLDDGSLGYLA